MRTKNLRTRIILIALVTAGLLAVPMTAMAASHEERAPTSSDDARARHDELVAAKRAAVDSFKENRSAVIADYRATFAALRESYQENKTRVIKECREKVDGATDDAPDAAPQSNMTKEEREAWAHCVRDGLKPLKADARAAIAQARDEARGALRDLARGAVEKFRSDEARTNAKYGRPDDSGSRRAATNDSTSG